MKKIFFFGMLVLFSVSPFFAEYKSVLIGEKDGIKIELDFSYFKLINEKTTDDERMKILSSPAIFTITNNSNKTVSLNSLYDNLVCIFDGEQLCNFKLSELSNIYQPNNYPDRIFKNSKVTFNVYLFNPSTDIFYLSIGEEKAIRKFACSIILSVVAKNNRNNERFKYEDIENVKLYYTLGAEGNKEIELNFLQE